MNGITVPTEPSTTRAPDAAGVEGERRGRSEAGPTPPDPRLDEATNSVEGPWLASAFDRAGEATVVFAPGWDPEREATPPGEGLDPERAQQEAARRAATLLRRFIAHHGCDRFGTLTYACRRCLGPCSCEEGPDRPTDSDLDSVWADIEDFRRRLYAALGERIPLALVIEHHDDGALHVHYAINRYIKKTVLEQCWRKRGYVEIRQFRAAGIRQMGQRERCRIIARYMSSYLKKDFTEGHVFARHRYSTTRGMAPRPRQWRTFRRTAALAWWSVVMGEEPALSWSSDSVDGWEGPPVDVGYWNGDPP